LLKEWGRIVHIFRENKDFSGGWRSGQKNGEKPVEDGPNGVDNLQLRVILT
jgi:hypothetical protein